MKKFSLVLTPSDILSICSGEYRGAAELKLDSVADPAQADERSIVFWEQDKYFSVVEKSSAGLIFCLPEGADKLPGRNLLLHPKPYFALMQLLTWWLDKTADKPSPGVHFSSLVEPSAQLGKAVRVAAQAVIGKNCCLGDNVIIGENCVLGEDVSIGAGTRLYPNVVVYTGCEIGSSCVIHSGAVIGADGFGFILLDGKQHKIPQTGNVAIGDNVEIGANTTIDRGTLGSTVIGEGTKIDNCVQIGHNCVIGKHSIICAQVGLAGSTVVGDYVYLAGQVGAAGHITIGDRAMVGAQSGVSSDVPADARWFGYPATHANEMKRLLAMQKHLPEIYKFYLKHRKGNDNEDQG